MQYISYSHKLHSTMVMSCCLSKKVTYLTICCWFTCGIKYIITYWLVDILKCSAKTASSNYVICFLHQIRICYTEVVLDETIYVLVLNFRNTNKILSHYESLANIFYLQKTTPLHLHGSTMLWSFYKNKC